MLSLQTLPCSPQSLRYSTKVGQKTAISLALTRRACLQQQKRSLWSSHFDHDCSKRALQQHRILKNKTTALTARSWERHNSGYPHAYGFKSFIHGAWNHRDIKSGTGWVKLAQSKTSRRETPPTWMDLHLCIQQFKTNLKESVRVMSEIPLQDPLHTIRMKANLIPEVPLKPSRTPTRSEIYHEKLRAQSQVKTQVKIPEEEERSYRIDPITNRKVYSTSLKEAAKPAPSSRKAIPVHTFASYRSSLFQNSEKNTPQAYTAETPKNHDIVREALKEYDAKVAYYSHGALYDVSECPRNLNDRVQAGLKEHDDKVSAKARQLGVYDSKKNVQPANNTRDEVHETIQHYQATSDRSTQLLRAITEYESKRPKFAEGMLKSEPKTHPIVQAIEEFERAKVASGYQSMSEKFIDPLLKTMHEYHEKLRLEKTKTEECGGIVDRQLMKILEPIEEYQASLSRARYHPKSVDTMKEYDSKVDYSRKRRESILRLEEHEKAEDLDLLRASDIRAAAGKSRRPRVETENEKTTKRKELEKAFAMSQMRLTLSAEESTAFDEVKKLRNTYSKMSANKQTVGTTEVVGKFNAVERPRSLTGNFVRDFPEEFGTLWKNVASGSLLPEAGSLQEGIKPKATAEASDFEQGRNFDVSRLETSLDRISQKPVQKVGSKASGFPESASGMPEIVHRKSESVEPTVYKILAYDPTMQSISQAETTSIVEDSAMPLTPADVLLRLSNPAKFFPQFLPLQNEGYEIVSGSGDVLVWRKIRSSSPLETKLSHEQPLSEEAHRKAITNPIDGMQRRAHTATGDYASPTGFVNHDLPRGSSPPYNIDVRREEPVFSGKSSWEGSSGEKPRRKGRGKKVLVSAVWVAGCCYAIGVISEFFRNGTGGLEGF